MCSGGFMGIRGRRVGSLVGESRKLLDPFFEVFGTFEVIGISPKVGSAIGVLQTKG